MLIAVWDFLASISFCSSARYNKACQRLKEKHFNTDIIPYSYETTDVVQLKTPNCIHNNIILQRTHAVVTESLSLHLLEGHRGA